jgi:hypothetical protein
MYLPEKASGLAQYVHELGTFPNGKHDDHADSTLQALNWIKGLVPYAGLLEFYRQESMRIRVMNPGYQSDSEWRPSVPKAARTNKVIEVICEVPTVCECSHL